MKIGIVGWCCRTGNGLTNAELMAMGWADRWLAPKHPKLGWSHDLLAAPATCCGVHEREEVFRGWLDGLDWLFYIEHEYCPGITSLAKQMGVRVACSPMMEWFLPRNPATQLIDLMWAPTQAAVRELRQIAEVETAARRRCDWAHNICGGRWGVDLEKFPFRLRGYGDQPEPFLFVNGHGGVNGRKGAEIVAAAARMVPECRVLVRSQSRSLPAMPNNVTVDFTETPTQAGLYDVGCALLAPSFLEGHGKQLYEAQACGLPVVTTNAPPMNECGAAALIRVERQSWGDVCGKPVIWSHPSPADLAGVMAGWDHSATCGLSNAASKGIVARFDLRHVLADLRREMQRLDSQPK